jgi:hypothetical protein
LFDARENLLNAVPKTIGSKLLASSKRTEPYTKNVVTPHQGLIQVRLMHDDDVSVGEVKRRQQMLRDHMAENDRLIGEAAQRVATSRALAAQGSGEGEQPERDRVD